MAFAGAVKVASSGCAAFAFSQDAASSATLERSQQHRALSMAVKPVHANVSSSAIIGAKTAISAPSLVRPTHRTRKSICKAVAAQDVQASGTETAAGDKVCCILKTLFC
jgi:hypothetical protein